MVYIYNEEGLLVERKTIDGRSGKIRDREIYIIKNSLVIEKQIEDYAYNFFAKVAYEYDEYGNILVLTEYVKKSNEYRAVGGDSFSYEYDTHGNWIKKILTKTQVTRIDVREITYY
jgi:hypothetical protein